MGREEGSQYADSYHEAGDIYIYIYESLLPCACSYLTVNELAPISKSESF